MSHETSRILSWQTGVLLSPLHGSRRRCDKKFATITNLTRSMNSTRMKQNILSVCFLLLPALALVLADQGEGARGELKHEDWAPAHYQIYATDGEPVAHDKVLDLLKSLQRVYEPFDNEQTNGRKEKINELIEVSNKDSSRCSPKYLRELHKLVQRHFSYRKGVLPYLKQHFNEYVSLCERHVLNANVARIETRDLSNMKKLADSVVHVEINGAPIGDLGQKTIRLNYLQKGILNFLENKDGGALNADSLPKFKALFETHVMNMCRVWMDATDPARAMNEFFVQVQFEADEIEWLDYGNLCHAIEKGNSRMVPKLFRQFKKSHSKLKTIKMALKKFNCLDRCTVSD